MATLCDTPARIRFRAAVRRKSWSSRPGTPAAAQARSKAATESYDRRLDGEPLSERDRREVAEERRKSRGLEADLWKLFDQLRSVESQLAELEALRAGIATALQALESLAGGQLHVVFGLGILQPLRDGLAQIDAKLGRLGEEQRVLAARAEALIGKAETVA